MRSELRPAIVVLLLLTVVTGVLYPLLVTGIGQVVFPGQANGSLIEREGKVSGSRLIGQPFSDPKYFWSRPSATGPVPYNAGASSSSNQGPLNPALTDAVKARGVPEEKVRELVAQHTQGRQLGVLGEPRVNVLMLNLALDALAR